jgi:hypothetical protein
MVESPVAAAIESEKTRILSIDPSLHAIQATGVGFW